MQSLSHTVYVTQQFRTNAESQHEAVEISAVEKRALTGLKISVLILQTMRVVQHVIHRMQWWSSWVERCSGGMKFVYCRHAYWQTGIFTFPGEMGVAYNISSAAELMEYIMHFHSHHPAYHTVASIPRVDVWKISSNAGNDKYMSDLWTHYFCTFTQYTCLCYSTQLL